MNPILMQLIQSLTMSRVTLFVCVLTVAYAKSNVIQMHHESIEGSIPAVTTRDVAGPGENLENSNPADATKDIPVSGNNLEDSIPADSTGNIPPPNKEKCAEIGQFCMNNSDCCSDTCLGYMKRCVSASG